MSILCVGEMLIDFTPGKEGPQSFIANPGGAPANVAVCIARNGGQAGFLGKLGNDSFGHLLADTLKKENVQMLCPELTDDAITTLAFVTLDEKNDRHFTFARKPGADMLLCEEDVKSVDFEQWDIVHAGSVSQSGMPEREAVLLTLKKAKEHGKLVSFDINFRENIWDLASCREQVDKVLPYVDLLKISEEELAFVGGRDHIPAFMKEHDIAVVVLTLGGDGSCIYFAGESKVIAPKKVEVKDTTGAGDSYWGTFLCKLLEQGIRKTEDISMEKLIVAGNYGTVASALCVQHAGGIPALPYRAEIDAEWKVN